MNNTYILQKSNQILNHITKRFSNIVMKDVINKYFRVFLILELCSTMVSRPLQVSNFYRGVGGGYFNNIERYLDIYFACLFV